MFSFLADRVPGILLCCAITVVAWLLQVVEVRLVGEAYLEALVLAIVLGVAIRIVWTPGRLWEKGIQFSARLLLEIAVVLLGASLGATAVLALGTALLLGIAATVVVAIGTSYAICRALRLPKRLSVLVACGNSICGNSAIAAVAPVIGATGSEIASSIAFTAVLGVIVVLTLPLLVPVLRLSLSQYGVLAGLTVYAVPQVLAATLPIGALSNQIGTIVKLVRVLMLGPVVFGLSLVGARLRPASALNGERAATYKAGLNQYVPWFIVGFLIVAVARSTGLIPDVAVKPVATVAGILTTISMAALGLGVDIRVVALAGVRVTMAVTLSLVVLAIISLSLIHAIGVR